VPRILLATLGSLGDLHPYIAVGRALVDRGHRARIATTLEYREAVEGAGLEFAPVRPPMEALGDRREIAERLFDPLRGVERLLREIVMPHLHEAHRDLANAAADADLLVSHPLTYTLPIVAWQQRKPWLSSVLAPMSLLSAHDPPAVAGFDALRLAHRLGPRVYAAVFRFVRRIVRRWEAPLHAFRRELGLPATNQVMTFEGQFSPLGTLALFDGALAEPQPDWPARTIVCGAAVFDGAGDPAQIAELERFLAAGEPPLVFALGSSAVWIADGYWQHAVAAAQRLGRRAILLSGEGVLPRLPDGVRAFAYLPYSRVFPHATVVIHQAGVGTLAQALRAGRPQLITPVAFDQPDNARRAARLGLARVLPFARVDARRFERELTQLLDEPRYGEAAMAVARTVSARDGAGYAADHVLATLAAQA